MNCKICGAEMQPEERFCPNCGNAVQQSEPAQPGEMPQQAAQVPEQVAEPMVQQAPQGQPGEMPQQAEAIPQPAANPTQPPPKADSSSGTEVPPMSDGMPMPAGAGMPAKAKRKRSKVGLILTLSIIPVIILLIIVIVLMFKANAMQKATDQSVESYWAAFTSVDGEGYAALVPDGYWDYISETYDFSKEECIAGMELFLQENADSLGGDLSYEWESTGFEYNLGESGDSEGAKDLKKHMAKYGLEYSASLGVSMDVTVEGASDSQAYSDTNAWLAKVDGKWYNLNAMVDFESICEEGYAQTAVYQQKFGEPMEKFWAAFYQNELDTIVGMLPEQTWDLIEANFGCDQTTAESYMQSYLDSVQEGLEIQDSKSVTLDLTVTNVDEATDDEVQEYNDAFSDYGMEITAVEYVTVNYDAVIDGESESDSFESTMIEMDGQWYVYDGIYLATEACYEMAGYGVVS